MKALFVIKIKPLTQAVPKFGSTAKRVKVYVVVFERPPQPLYENIVLTPSSSIHANGDAVALKQICKGLAGKLSALGHRQGSEQDVCQGEYQDLITGTG